MPRRQAAASIMSTRPSSSGSVLLPSDTNSRKRNMFDLDLDRATSTASLSAIRKTRKTKEMEEEDGKFRGEQKKDGSEKRRSRKKKKSGGEMKTTAVPSGEEVKIVASVIKQKMKDKGKSKETVATREALLLENARLKEELAAQSILLRRHQTHLREIQQSLTCEICLDLLDRPFALSPCGHVGCYKCLTMWFKPSTDDTYDDEDDGWGATPSRNGQKKCPVCRASVLNRPIEMWGMKSIVNGILGCGLADLEPKPVVDVDEVQVTTPNADPWFGIFEPLTQDVRRPRDEVRTYLRTEERGIFDVENWVYRCIDCNHEIRGRVCSNEECERIYEGHDDSGEEERYRAMVQIELETGIRFGGPVTLGDYVREHGGDDGDDDDDDGSLQSDEPGYGRGFHDDTYWFRHGDNIDVEYEINRGEGYEITQGDGDNDWDSPGEVEFVESDGEYSYDDNNTDIFW